MLMQGTTSQVPPKEQLHRRSELERQSQCIQTKPGGRQPGKAGQERAFRDPASAAVLTGVWVVPQPSCHASPKLFLSHPPFGKASKTLNVRCGLVPIIIPWWGIQMALGHICESNGLSGWWAVWARATAHVAWLSECVCVRVHACAYMHTAHIKLLEIKSPQG